jgi:hypothetical protein
MLAAPSVVTASIRSQKAGTDSHRIGVGFCY